ncbi:hypothetical protein GCM10023081_20090 [Arthrobacter ginkgonis]|uniref:Uncharacterized protein n=1 Tax=Arthrobacter ginkgonis TaxID=1630594 RepID=A0ABP7CAX1_9MICC
MNENVNRKIPSGVAKAKPWTNRADELLQDPDAYYEAAEKKAQELAQASVRRPLYRQAARLAHRWA